MKGEERPNNKMFFRHYRRFEWEPRNIFSLATILIVVFLSILPQSSYCVQIGLWEKKYEGEIADQYFDTRKIQSEATMRMGYTGNGYADFGGKGSFVQWNVETTLEWADYEITIRYSAPNQRRCDIYVDDARQGSYSIDSTVSWDVWRESNPVAVSLEKGSHWIKVVAVGESGPNVDYLKIRAIDQFTIVDEPDKASETGNSTSSEEMDVSALKEQPFANMGTSFALVLEKESSLERGQFIWSPGGSYKMGLVRSTGELVISLNSTNEITWSNGVLGGEKLFMQPDGNLVVRNNGSSAIWDSQSGMIVGAELKLEINDDGIATITSGSYVFWTSPYPLTPSFNSGGSVGGKTRGRFPGNPNFMRFKERVVLNSLENLSQGDFISSPSNMYQIGLDDAGDFVLRDASTKKIVWNANITGCSKGTMQPDGNLVLRDHSNKLMWTTHTSGNPGAQLVVDNGGRLSIMVDQTAIWMEGIPRGIYDSVRVSPSLQFPLRGMFYYPWYPETWSINSKPVKFIPDLGKYSSDDASIVEEHIDAMEYAYTDIAIASWWGPGKSQELSRLSLLMDTTFAMKSPIKWTVYYEDEMFRNPTIETIRGDLEYLRKWFIWHPAWAFIEEKPVVYVYNEAGCDVVERWMEAASEDWYVVLKVFPGYNNCNVQPNSYHQYGPSSDYIHIKDVSTSVSPGFWRADMEEPKLHRLSKEKFCENVKKMVATGENWQLVTTFNEAGEGTLVEASSANWGSDTKYGYYLDCLHTHH